MFQGCITVQLSMFILLLSVDSSSTATLISYHIFRCLSTTFLIIFKLSFAFISSATFIEYHSLSFLSRTFLFLQIVLINSQFFILSRMFEQFNQFLFCQRKELYQNFRHKSTYFFIFFIYSAIFAISIFYQNIFPLFPF